MRFRDLFMKKYFYIPREIQVFHPQSIYRSSHKIRSLQEKDQIINPVQKKTVSFNEHFISVGSRKATVSELNETVFTFIESGFGEGSLGDVTGRASYE